MSELWILLGLMASGIFLWLRPRYKILVSFIIMTYGFNIIPRSIMNVDIWDPGAVLLLISGAQLIFMKAVTEPLKANYLTALKLLIAWLCICLIWSLVIYQYPIFETLKASRQLIIGYLSVFIFIRLFRVDAGALEFLLKVFYWLTFCLSAICIVQYLLHIEILFVLTTTYGNTFRFIPTFFPISTLLLWVISSKLLSDAHVKWHEFLYLLMVAMVTATTFTRGIYIAVPTIFILMFVILLKSRKMKFNRTFAFLASSVSLILILALGGVLDNVISRAFSGIELISGKAIKPNHASKDNYDTFTGRLATTMERFEMVSEKNPLVGFGFLHEDLVPLAVRNKIKYGSVITTEKYLKMYANSSTYTLALFTADIDWANVVVYMGFVGLTLLLCFILLFVIHYLNNISLRGDKYYFFRLGTFLQLLTLVLLMFNGSTLTSMVQIPAFMIAGYTFFTSLEQKMALGEIDGHS